MIKLKNIGLKEGEEIRYLIRRSLWSYFWRLLLSAVLIILSFFLMYPLFKSGWWGIGGFGALLLFGLVLFLRTFSSYYFTVFVMTNFRIIDVDQNGFFNRVASAVLYSKIQDVSYEARGVVGAIFRLGDVYIDFLNKQKIQLKLTTVRNPQMIVSNLLALQDDYLRESGYDDAEAKILLNKIKLKIGREAFNKLIADE